MDEWVALLSPGRLGFVSCVELTVILLIYYWSWGDFNYDAVGTIARQRHQTINSINKCNSYFTAAPHNLF